MYVKRVDDKDYRVAMTPKEFADFLFDGKYLKDLRKKSKEWYNFTLGQTEKAEEEEDFDGWYGVKILSVFDSSFLIMGYYGGGDMFSVDLYDHVSQDGTMVIASELEDAFAEFLEAHTATTYYWVEVNRTEFYAMKRKMEQNKE